MTDAAERVATTCPACSPGAETAHEVLSPGDPATVRCGECGHVHKTALDGPETVALSVVVSQSGESFPASVDAPAAETVAVGEEFVVDTDEVLMAVRITAIETGPEQRVEEATIREVDTVWTRAVDNVEVNVTVHPADGRRDETRSLTVAVPGDHDFVVGETQTFGEERFVVEQVLVRDDAVGYPTTKFEREGDDVPAKDVKRVYAREPGGRAWSAW
ncbi:MAG: HVO_0476 family zinc finger protein [Halobacteriales archaeon]